jgi:hypothetical protein
MSSASDTTSRRKQRVLYADKIIQQTSFDKGWKKRIVLEGGNSDKGATSYTPFYNWRDGTTVTLQAEVDAYIASVPDRTPPATFPDAPTGVSAVGANGQATITFTAPVNNGGAAITSYKVTSSPATTTVTGSSSPITFTGLTNGVSYTFTVVATNSVGDSVASAPSNSVTSATTPGAPTGLVVNAGNAEASISFIAGSDGGSAITNYEYSTDGSSWTALSPADASSPVTVTGLTNGVAYTIYLRAGNAVGSGASSASVSVTPIALTTTSFTTTGSTTWTAPAGVTSVQYLVVGGGGGGGGAYDVGGGGGGGGGLVLTGTKSVTPGSTYTIVVGAGGAGGVGTGNEGGETPATGGSNSSFADVIARGGGLGGGSLAGRNGVGGAQGNAGTLTAPTGANGGRTVGGYGYGGGGGGGMGSAGGSSPAVNQAGAGGSGVTRTIGSITVTVAAGGNGGDRGSDYDGANGAANTGNGGEGAAAISSDGSTGGTGGSGRVIIAYEIARVPGTAMLAASFYDNANLVDSSGNTYTTLNSNFSKMAADSAGNTIVAGYYRTGTLTLNRPDTDGITQISTTTETFDGNTNFVQSPTTYYNGNLFISKYSTLGVPTWSAKISGSTNIGMNMYEVACDSSNNVYALVGNGHFAGGATNTVTVYNADGTAFGAIDNVSGFGNTLASRYLVVKYSSAGVVQWVNTITTGDDNNQFVFANNGNIAVDNANNVYVTAQVQRVIGGTGPTSVKLYKYSSVSAGVIQVTLATSDNYAFGGVDPYDTHRGYLVKLDSTGTYTWIARMAIPTAYGESNGGGITGNIVFDSANNIYICQNSINSASSSICNIYNGVTASSSPLPDLAAPYYRYDLRGASISPSLPQYYRYVAILKFNSSGVFQGACGTHQLLNGSELLGMNGSIGINKTTGSLYMAMNAQGFSGTNAGSGAQLNKLYVDSFSANVANGSNYDITVTNTFNVPLAQPQTVVAVVKFNSSLQAQSVAYIDTPGGNAGGFYGTNASLSVDSYGNVYVPTTIKNSTLAKTIYTFNSLSGSTATFNTFGTVTVANANTDGLIVSYEGDLDIARWATVVSSSDGLNDAGLACQPTSDNYIFVGGNSTLNKGVGSNTIGIKSYSTVIAGAVQNTLFGNLDVTAATDRAGFLIKYE